jgi:hypothetical protein
MLAKVLKGLVCAGFPSAHFHSVITIVRAVVLRSASVTVSTGLQHPSSCTRLGLSGMPIRVRDSFLDTV